MDGIRTIHQLKYTIDEKSENPNDNIFSVHNPRIFYINISTFLTHIPFGSEEYYNYDLREPKRKIIHPDKIKETKKTVVTTNDWSNIPYYPTTREKRENVAKYLMSMGKPIPDTLIKQIEEDKRKEIEQDSFNNFINSNSQFEEEPVNYQSFNTMRQNQPIYQTQQITQISPNIQQYYVQRQMPTPPPNKFSPQYAAYIGVKPRAQTSARIGLGGAY